MDVDSWITVAGGIIMGSTVHESVKEGDKQRVISIKWYKNWKIITTGTIMMIALIIAGISYYQATHFNAISRLMA